MGQGGCFQSGGDELARGRYSVWIVKALAALFLLPGTMVINMIGISVEEDGGILRSFINMCFWGVIVTWITLSYFL